MVAAVRRAPAAPLAWLGAAALGAPALGAPVGSLPGPGPAVVAEVDAAWLDYRRRYLRRSGRVVDPRQDNITTSEGQAYGMLRAVWADDRRSFDRMRRWTRVHLQDGDDTALPAWKWGRREGRLFKGVVDPQPAADADQFMAYALLLAAERWDAPAYADQARGLLRSIWEQEVQQVAGDWVVLPGPWAAGLDPVQLNPSYGLPFAWRAFAAADPAHPWLQLVDGFYALLARTDRDGEPVLAPDWLWLDRASGAAVSPPDDPRQALHGFEAFRIAWTLAAEVHWYRDDRARRFLAPYLALEERWNLHGWIPAVMDADGEPQVDYPYLGLYGALLPAWAVAQDGRAARLYARELAPQRARWGWGDEADYYSQNWTWLGLALWCGAARPPEMFR